METIQITEVGSTKMNCRKLLSRAQVKESPVVVSETKRKPSFKEKQEYDKLQEDIESLEKQKETLTTAISSGSTDHQELQKLSQEIQNIADKIEQKTLRWLELGEIM